MIYQKCLENANFDFWSREEKEGALWGRSKREPYNWELDEYPVKLAECCRRDRGPVRCYKNDGINYGRFFLACFYPTGGPASSSSWRKALSSRTRPLNGRPGVFLALELTRAGKGTILTTCTSITYFGGYGVLKMQVEKLLYQCIGFTAAAWSGGPPQGCSRTRIV